MPVEQREQVTRVEINRVNWQQEEPAGFGGRRQPLSGGTSRVNREVYARFCERLGVNLPGPTRRVGRGLAAALSPTLPAPPPIPSRDRQGAVQARWHGCLLTNSEISRLLKKASRARMNTDERGFEECKYLFSKIGRAHV